MNRITGFAILFLCTYTLACWAEIEKAPDAPQPMTPEQSVAQMRLPDGFRIELVASEPVVQEPSCLTFDERGRMFVTELHGYNVEGEIDVAKLNKTGKLDTEVRRLRWEFIGGEVADEAKHKQFGKVKLLSDTDGDGRMDKADVWADDLPAAYGVIAARGGIIVVAAPDIVFLADRDGDGKPEVRETLFTGFKKREMERGINNPRWGLDNWIYVGAGGHGGTITGPHLENPVELHHSDFRIKADGSVIEPVTGRVGTFGLAMNDVGDRFPCSGGQPAIYALPMPYQALIRNPDVAMPSTNQSAANYNNGYRISQPHPWRVHRRADPAWIKFYGNRETDSNYFTGGCGGEIYNADLFPEEYRGNFFYCEPSLNIVHRCVLTRDGAGYKARRAPGEEKREFLASKDQWFRPMNLRLGPDGALYIIDMYREIIEDYSAIPRFLQQQYGLEKGRDKGRIWRLLPKDSDTKIESVADDSISERIKNLSHPNIEKRITAQRLLIENGSEGSEQEYKSKVKSLHQVVHGGSTPLGRLHAMHTLQGLGELADEDIVEALADDDYRVRTHALRLTSTLGKPLHTTASGKAILATKPDQDPTARLQMAITLGDIAADFKPARLPAPYQSPSAARPLRTPSMILRTIAEDSESDPRWVAAAILSSARYANGIRLTDVVHNLQDSDTPPIVRELLYPLAKFTAKQHEGEIYTCLYKLRSLDEETQSACLQGFLDGIDKNRTNKKSLRPADVKTVSSLLFNVKQKPRRLATRLAAIMLDENTPRLKGILIRELTFAMNEELPADERIAAIKTLGYAKSNLLAKQAETLLSAKQPPAIRHATIEAIGNYGDTKTLASLFANWASYTPATKKATLETVLSKQQLRPAIIEALNSRTLSLNALTTSQRERLFSTNTDLDVEHLRKTWTESQSSFRSDFPKLLKAYTAALSENRDIANGKKLFESTCLNCHKLNDQGHEVGPPLGSVINKPDEAILSDIIDPSSKIDSEYASYLVVTEQGTSFTGVLASESATSITLKMEKGREETILRNEIEQLKASEVSLMPSDLHKQIPPQAMADLLGYLRKTYSE